VPPGPKKRRGPCLRASMAPPPMNISNITQVKGDSWTEWETGYWINAVEEEVNIILGMENYHVYLIICFFKRT